jgi:hypothetical protein
MSNTTCKQVYYTAAASRPKQCASFTKEGETKNHGYESAIDISKAN